MSRNGKPFPDGAKMAKIHWTARKNVTAPGQPLVAGPLHDIDFMVKDTNRFADSGGWGYAEFEYENASGTFRPGTLRISRRRGTMPSAGSRATQ